MGIEDILAKAASKVIISVCKSTGVCQIYYAGDLYCMLDKADCPCRSKYKFNKRYECLKDDPKEYLPEMA
jgi:hypothetical protein